MRNKFFVLIILLAVIVGCSKDEDLSQSRELLNVSYGNELRQVYDIYLPADRSIETTKVIVLVHGGGWSSGDKSDLEELYEYFKRSEYAIVNINYTYADFINPPIPMQTDEIASLLQHLRKKQDDYQIKTEYAFVGASAGAHLSMLYAYRFDVSNEVKLIGNVVGPVDFLHESYVNPKEPETAQLITIFQFLFGLNANTNPDDVRDVSPYYWLDENTVPTISFYGGKDLLVPKQQGEILHHALDSLGVTNQYVFYEEEGHGWGEPTLSHSIQQLELFIQEHF
jgi:acetyl esterase/lipase